MGLGAYFSPINALSKQKCVMHRAMRKPCTLNSRHYASGLTKLNNYLDIFPRSYATNKMGKVELDENLLRSMPNGWGK